MRPPNPTLIPTLLTTSTLLLPSHAQTTSNPQNTSTCPPTYQPNLSTSPINATGTLNWTWDILLSSNAYTLPWYFSVLINATTDDTQRSDKPRVTASTYISVPGDLPNETRICAYQFGSINATLDDATMDDAKKGTHRCKGAISDSCIEFLEEGWKEGGARGDRCPDYYEGVEGRRGFEERCPELGAGSARWSTYKDPTNTSCPTTHLPHVDLPDGYISLNTPSQLSPYKDFEYEESASTEQTYDLMTRQVVPLVVRAELKGEGDVWQGSTEYLCVVADGVVEGSRRVEGGVPWSAGGRVRARSWVVGVGMLVGILLL